MTAGTFLATLAVGFALMNPIRSSSADMTLVTSMPTEVVSTTETESVSESELSYSLYPTCGVVSELNEANDLVIFTDFNGNEWEFKGVEDWIEGDIVSAIMSDNCTPENIYDDVIVQTRYSGWVY